MVELGRHYLCLMRDGCTRIILYWVFMPVELSCYLGDLMLRNDRLHALYEWDEKKVMLGHSGRAHTRVSFCVWCCS